MCPVLRVSPSVFLALIWSSHLPLPPPNTILEASTSRMTDWGFGDRALRSSGKFNHPHVSTLANKKLKDSYYSHSKTTTQKWTEEEENPLCFHWHGNCMIPRLKTTGKEGETKNYNQLFCTCAFWSPWLLSLQKLQLFLKFSSIIW